MALWDWIFDATGMGETETLEPSYIGTGNPLADPLLTAASQRALLNLGVGPDPTLASQSSPISVALSRYLNQNPHSAPGIRDFTHFAEELSSAIASGQESSVLQVNQWRLGQLAGAVGMSVEELVQAQQQHSVQQKQQFAQAQELAELNRTGQFDAAQQLAALIGDLPDVSASGIEALRGQEKERILRELNRFTDEQRLGATRQANFANYNPGRVLGDIEESRTRGFQDADLDSLEYALGLLGGQQNLSVSRGTQLQSFIDAPGQFAAQLAGIRAGGLNVPTQAIPQQVIPGRTTRALDDFTGLLEGFGSAAQGAGSVMGAM